MSDSEDGASIPSNATIEKALQDVVADLYRTNNTDDLTVKRVRASAEEQLGLPDGYLKEGPWKEKSKEIITEAVNSHEDEAAQPSSPPPPPAEKKSKAKAEISKPKKSAKEPSNKRGQKRVSPDTTAKPQKRRKVVASDEEEEESELSSPPLDEDDVQMDDEQAEDETETNENKLEEPQTTAAADDSSELSDVIDEPPKPKRGKKGSTSKAPKESKKSKSTKSKAAKPKDDMDPQEAEIKRLQGWLVKCGIRKVWGAYLKPYETNKAKINHLKGMLKDAGMDGRYSAEKASQIKERRELAADLEEVQAGNKRWGQEKSGEDSGGDEDGEAEAKPRRRLIARGLASLPQFSDDDDSE